MNQTRLVIARHGETDYNRNGLLQGRGIDAPLNKTGQEQGRLLADYLCKYEATSLVSSSLTRAWQTASFYEEKTDLSVRKNKDLDEMDFGDFEGVAMNDIAKELNDLQNGWMNGETSLRVPGGESPKEVFERADDAVRSYLNTADSEVIVLFVHGRLIRILLSEWLGYGLKNMHRIEHQNGAVNSLILKKTTFEPVYLNKIDHLNMLTVD